MSHIQYFLATGFYSGYSPVAPGTAGSLLVVVLFLFFPSIPIGYHLLLISLMVFLGIWSSSRVATDLGKDPSIVVIDEMTGMFIAIFACPRTLIVLFLGFFLFRFFDILKPFPIRNVEKLSGGLGIMLDDIIAGIFAFAIIQSLLVLKIL